MQLINITEFNIPVLVLVVFTHDFPFAQNILASCPNQFTTEKIENKNIAPKKGKCFPSYSNDSRKTEDESQVEKLQVGQLVSE